MHTQFKTNAFSNEILDSWSDFAFKNCKTYKQNLKQVMSFEWSFKTYKGRGYIYYDDKHQLCNKTGDNDSYLSLDKSSRDIHPGLKPTDSLYNDPNLAIVFQRILDHHFDA